MKGNRSTDGKSVCVGEVFSDYVARLGPGGEPPDLASLEEVRGGLRGALVGELRQRGLWQSPPYFLGLPGAKWDGDTLEELVSDAYVFNFVRRLRGLHDQQRLLGNIRPMVVKNIRNFLTELQKKADPLGYRVFGRLRQAVKRCIEREELFLLSSKPETKKIRLNNGSILGFQPACWSVAQRAELTEPVSRWAEELLPRLITAEGRAVPKEVKRLAEKVGSLRAAGVTAFELGDLAAELKGDVRGRWQGVWKDSLGELGREQGEEGGQSLNIRVTRTSEEPDWPRRQALIEECVAQSIDRQRPMGNRRDLLSLWTLIRVTRLPRLEDGPLPSYTELGRQLKLTRGRVKKLFERLKPLVLACLHVDLPAISGLRNPRAKNTLSIHDQANDSADEIQRPLEGCRRRISP